ncbi:Serine protein kinase [Aspergillus sclerotialis]|uniref:Serine protein kinase n=1 Tax=Aspergillus sclerotialis TaxID=2070753 RepID=A0A3A2ZMF6_9EURO|nr:Serine protein kinase [Aspergillus sclerotialis]
MVSTIEDTRSEMLLDPPEFSPVRWLEGTIVDDSAPKYLIPSQRRRGPLDGVDFSKLVVKIGYLGGAIQNPQRGQRPVTPTALRAPELIHRGTWNAGIDIWALGCLIFELATNEPLFPSGTFGLSAEQIDEEHIYLISQLLDGNGYMNETFVKHLTDRLPPDFGAKNVQRLASLLWLMLERDPEKRMPTAKLLDQPFLIEEIES